MLAIFHKTVACGPEALASPGSGRRGVDVVAKYVATYPHSVCMKFDEISSMAYSHERQALLTPRSFATVDDLFCLFEGGLDNLAALRQRYGLSKTVNEALLFIEAYRALRDRAPYPADQVVADLGGHFGFILYDNQTRKIFVAADALGKVHMYWGTTCDGAVVFSDDEELIKESCGKSFAPFPQGCYFSSDGGLQSFEHPLKEVKAVPRVDSDGQAFGPMFQVEADKTRPRTDVLTSWGVV